MRINLISDTVTKPTEKMLEYMMKAEVGDDVFQDDPTAIKLERKAAKLFGKEAGLFCPSGTMCNQIAIKVHTNPLDEIICHKLSHIKQSEAGAYSFISNVTINQLEGKEGKIGADQVESAIQPEYDWTPRSKLVVLENSVNLAGGTIYTKEELAEITTISRKKGLKTHLDGARVFNAMVETGDSPAELGEQFDSLGFCLSKGLGAPVGSVLLGTKEFIKSARRIRKVIGGGMRQIGYLAAAGIYALDHHVDRLKKDHKHARMMAQALRAIPSVENIRPTNTNIVLFDLKPPLTAENFLKILEEHRIYGAAFGPQTVRLVTHLDFSEKMLDKVLHILNKMEF